MRTIKIDGPEECPFRHKRDNSISMVCFCGPQRICSERLTGVFVYPEQCPIAKHQGLKIVIKD